MSNIKCSSCGNSEYLCSCSELACRSGGDRLSLVEDACRAVELFGEDELEAFAANARAVSDAAAVLEEVRS